MNLISSFSTWKHLDGLILQIRKKIWPCCYQIIGPGFLTFLLISISFLFHKYRKHQAVIRIDIDDDIENVAFFKKIWQ